MSLAGMDPLAFLREKNGMRRAIMQVIATRVNELEQERDQYRANLIANEVIRRIK